MKKTFLSELERKELIHLGRQPKIVKALSDVKANQNLVVIEAKGFNFNGKVERVILSHKIKLGIADKSSNNNISNIIIILK